MMSRVSVTRMEQFIGKEIEMVVAGEEGSRIGILRGVDGRMAKFSDFDVWIPSIKDVAEIPLR